MPQPRQRIVFCDCLDCTVQPASTDVPNGASSASEAAARQEPPPKCLLLLLTGVLATAHGAGTAGTLLDTLTLPHIHRTVDQGGLVLLTQRAAAPADSTAELAQLLGVYEARMHEEHAPNTLALRCIAPRCDTAWDGPVLLFIFAMRMCMQEWQQQQPLPSLPKRFKGLQLSFASNCPAACALAAGCGAARSAVLVPPVQQQQHGDGDGNSDGEGSGAGLLLLPPRQRPLASNGNYAAAAGEEAAAALPDPAETARRILQELALMQADAGLDILLVHVDAHTLAGSSAVAGGATAASAVLTWADRTLRYLNNSTAFRDSVLLTLLASPGASGPLEDVPSPLVQRCGEDVPLHALTPLPHATPGSKAAGGDGAAPQQQQQQQQHNFRGRSSIPLPLQSWQQLGGVPLAIDVCRPLLAARRLPCVLRRDGAARFSLAEAPCGSGAIVIDRLIPEIAYKLGRAPKYGA